MTRAAARPAGLLGVTPDWKASYGVHVAGGIKGPTGAPVLRDTFHLLTPHAHSVEVSGPNKLHRDPLPAFEAWNERATAPAPCPKCHKPIRRDEVECPFCKAKPIIRVGEPLPETVSLRGVIAHSRLEDCFRWNRADPKAPNGLKSPPSGRPWCEGNGVEAVRIETMPDGEEREKSIPCPNEECRFAIAKACKPKAEMLFMLRWDGGPSWQAGFPSLLALHVHHSWNSLRSQLGLFALVLGTEAVLPWEPRETWRPGLAAEMGVENPSLTGFPFRMTVGMKTQQPKNGQPGRRFPVISFSQEGDLGAWLSAQIQRRRFFLAGGAEPLALPPSIHDPELQPALDVAHVEIEPAIDTRELPGLQVASARVEAADPRSGQEEEFSPPPEPQEPPVKLLTRADVTRLRLEAQRAGCPLVDFDDIVAAKSRFYGPGNVPAWEAEKIRAAILERAQAAKSRP